VAIHAVVEKVCDDAIVTACSRGAGECAVVCRSSFYDAVAGAVNRPLDGHSEGCDAGSRNILDAGGVDRDGPFVFYFLVESLVKCRFILWGLGRFMVAPFRESLEI
jgi:hypothetical protein